MSRDSLQDVLLDYVKSWCAQQDRPVPAPLSLEEHKVDWKQGSASLLVTMCMTLLIVVLMILYMVSANILYANSIAMTRTDAIADSAAVYAQSYDYKYNKSQAEIMTNLLTAYNNQSSDFYSISTGISFPDDNTMNVKCVVKTPTFYPDLMGGDQLYAFDESTVKSVDIYGDVLQVPEDISGQWRDPIQDSHINPGEVEDSVTVPGTSTDEDTDSSGSGGNLSYTEEDLYWLARVTYAEAGCSWFPDWVQRDVASVVLNRVKDPRYPNSIKEVIFDPYQYECVDNGSIYDTPSQQCIDNARYVLEHGSTLPASVIGQSAYAWGPVYKTYTDPILGTTIKFFSC